MVLGFVPVMWIRRWEWAGLFLAGCSGAAKGDGAPPTELAPVPSATAAPEARASATTPAPEPAYEIAVNVFLRAKGREKRTFWVYQPKPLPAKLGLVLVAPSGSSMLSGKALSSDERAEHLPYVRAGFAVVAYSLDGDMPAGVSDAQATAALSAYQASRAGVENAGAAIDLALEKLPGIDGSLVFAAGRGSAGAHALLLAAEEPRVRGAVAFAPVTRLTGDVGVVVAVDKALPGYAKFIRWSLPDNRVYDVRVPLFIHQSSDDEVVRASHTDAYVERLRAAEKAVTYVRGQGDHVTASVEHGLPQAIAWLRAKRGE